MIRYRTNDGEALEGINRRAIIRKLRELSRDPEPNEEAFMAAMADRVLKQTGTVVPTNSEAAFVAALVEAGLLIEETENGSTE
jgi:hypothetical protein